MENIDGTHKILIPVLAEQFEPELVLHIAARDKREKRPVGIDLKCYEAGIMIAYNYMLSMEPVYKHKPLNEKNIADFTFKTYIEKMDSILCSLYPDEYFGENFRFMKYFAGKLIDSDARVFINEHYKLMHGGTMEEV